MLKLNKILVPTDFSKGSKDAFNYARALSSKFGGTIDFIHVIPMLKYLNESISKLGIPLDMDKDIYPKILNDARKRVKDELDINIPKEQRGESFVKIDRKPHASIVDFAKNNGYDIIVMGARGSHENSLLKGSTTEKVIRNSEVPVLAVQGDIAPKDVNRVLIPTDYSDLSIVPIEYVVSMATSLEAEITLLHVLELYGSPIENEPSSEAGRGDVDSIADKLLEKIKKYLEANPLGGETWDLIEEDGQPFLQQKSNTSRKIKLNVVVLRGISAHYAITDFANESSDIIVMATHGRSGLSHLFLGSTTEKVIMSTDIPVLTVRPPKRKK